jgi:hypothetical protein
MHFVKKNKMREKEGNEREEREKERDKERENIHDQCEPILKDEQRKGIQILNFFYMPKLGCNYIN